MSKLPPLSAEVKSVPTLGLDSCGQTDLEAAVGTGSPCPAKGV